jgi:hypothetical protein
MGAKTAPTTSRLASVSTCVYADRVMNSFYYSQVGGFQPITSVMALIPAPPHRVRKETLSVRVDPEMRELLDAYCKYLRCGVSLSRRIAKSAKAKSTSRE